MAPKREKSLLENPPAASSSEDEDVEGEVGEEEEEEDEEVVGEEEDEEEEEEDDEEDDEDEVATTKTNPSSAVKKPNSDPTPNSGSKSETPSDDEEEEEEDDDESEESDSEPTPSNLKPLGSSRGSNPSGGKPIVSQPKKTVSKPSTTATPTAKRPLESEKDSKRKKKKVDDAEDSHPEQTEVRSTFGPKNIFQRLWSDEDEIVVLRGMIESKKKGVDPFSDLGEFFESIKKSLQCEVKLDQLNNKIKRLKKKYLNNFKRGSDGEDPVFSKPHEVLSYELMKEIWGGKEGNVKGGGGASNGKVVSGLAANGKKSRSRKPTNAASRTKTLSLSDIEMKESSSKMDERNGSLHPCVEGMIHSRNSMNMVGGSFLKQGLNLIEDSKSKDLEQKWKGLYAAELQLYLRRVELVREQTIAILDAYKSSEHELR